MIRLSNVYKSFGGTEAIKGINLEIQSGRVTGIIGANGSGKSTLLRMIATILSPTYGSITVNGFDTVNQKMQVKRLIGLMLGGSAHLYDEMSAYENLKYHAALQNIPANLINDRVRELARMLDIETYLHRKTAGFSRGMRQKVLFAKTIIHTPEILLLDEPTTGLDIDSIIELHKLIKQIKESGKTVILSSHNVRELESLCDDLIIINGGTVMAYGEKDKLMHTANTDNITELYMLYRFGGAK